MKKDNFAFLFFFTIFSLISICVSLQSSAIAQKRTHERTGWEQEGLKGKVKETVAVTQHIKKNEAGEEIAESFMTIIHQFDESGNLISLCKEMKNPDIEKKTHLYDRNNNRIETRIFKDGKLSVRTKFSYNEDSQIIKSESFDSEDKLLGKNEHFYTDGRLLRELLYNKSSEMYGVIQYRYEQSRTIQTLFLHDKLDSKTISDYDQHGNLTVMEKFDTAGRSIHKLVQRWSGSQNILSKTIYLQNALFERTEYVYNENNQLIEKSDFDKTGEFSFKYIYKYKEGKLLGIAFYKKDIPSTYTLCTYDAQGNKISETKYDYQYSKVYEDYHLKKREYTGIKIQYWE